MSKKDNLKLKSRWDSTTLPPFSLLGPPSRWFFKFSLSWELCSDEDPLHQQRFFLLLKWQNLRKYILLSLRSPNVEKLYENTSLKWKKNKTGQEQNFEWTALKFQLLKASFGKLFRSDLWELNFWELKIFRTLFLELILDF